MAYLHHENRIHGDIKPDNLLVDRAGRLAVTDFGTSRIMKQLRDPAKSRPQPQYVPGKEGIYNSDEVRFGRSWSLYDVTHDMPVHSEGIAGSAMASMTSLPFLTSLQSLTSRQPLVSDGRILEGSGGRILEGSGGSSTFTSNITTPLILSDSTALHNSDSPPSDCEKVCVLVYI